MGLSVWRMQQSISTGNNNNNKKDSVSNKVESECLYLTSSSYLHTFHGIRIPALSHIQAHLSHTHTQEKKTQEFQKQQIEHGHGWKQKNNEKLLVVT